MAKDLVGGSNPLTTAISVYEVLKENHLFMMGGFIVIYIVCNFLNQNQMKKLALLLLLTASSCSVTKMYHVDTSHLSFRGTDIYYDGQLCAKLKGVEIAYDDKKIVREMTYVLTDVMYDQYALNIIAFVHEHKPTYEVEVEYFYMLNGLELIY